MLLLFVSLGFLDTLICVVLEKHTFRGSHPSIPSPHPTPSHTSIVLPLEAVRTSPGRMPPPLIMFSHAAITKWTWAPPTPACADSDQQRRESCGTLTVACRGEGDSWRQKTFIPKSVSTALMMIEIIPNHVENIPNYIEKHSKLFKMTTTVSRQQGS